jgi:hypothetical protein
MDFPNVLTEVTECFTNNSAECEMDGKTRREVYYDGTLELFM